MENIWFYIQMGLNHVLDFSAYDHILFLSALAVPFTFKNWKMVLFLATVFTLTHCFSLFLSVYGLVVMDVGLIEFLIPVTILCTAFFNLVYLRSSTESKGVWLHVLATSFFGLIHGFGFSNYFKMLIAGEEQKTLPLIGFALGIELSQVLIVLSVLFLGYLAQSVFKVRHYMFVTVVSILIVLITIPMLIGTFPW